MATKKRDLIHSYLALRKTVGWIGLLLPFVLMLGVFIIFKGKVIDKSISHYYYSGMGDVFVGAICAIALFLFFYYGHNNWDNWTGNIAGLFALGVAWFPTTESGPITATGIVHFVCAASFFLTLAAFSLFLFTKKAINPTPQKLKRNIIYIVCGIIMILCLVAIVIYKVFFEKSYPCSSFVFWGETFALIAFGISWLTKGGTIYPDN